MRRLLTIGALAAVAAVAPAAAIATGPGAKGKIAYMVQSGTSLGWNIDTVNPDGTGTETVAPDAQHPAWSSDGTRLAFRDLATRAIWVSNADGSGRAQVSSPAGTESDSFPTWLPDGSLAFVRVPQAGQCSELFAVRVDGTAEAQLAPTERCHETALDAAPDGRLAYGAWDDDEDTVHLYVAAGDNTGAERLRSDANHPSWSPDGGQLAFGWAGIFRMWLDDPLLRSAQIWRPDPPQSQAHHPDFAPDGEGFVFSVGRDIWSVDDVGGSLRAVTDVGCCRLVEHPDWQPLPPRPPLAGYPRPRTASPVRVSLVPAYEECASPNREHGPPLAFGSCAPPAQRSSYLTVGTGDGGPHGPNSVGFVRLAVLTGDPATQADEADVKVQVRITDVRCRGATVGCSGGESSDYTGELDLPLSLRVTDRYSGGSGDHPATLVDRMGFPWRHFPLEIPCAATAATTVGSTCELTTTVDALDPAGFAREGARAVWQLGQIELADGGEDGEAASDDNTLFAVQGIFVP